MRRSLPTVLRLVRVILFGVVGAACIQAPAPESPFADEPFPTVATASSPAAGPTTTGEEGSLPAVRDEPYFDRFTYDVHVPAIPPARPAPVVVLVHGGGLERRATLGPLADALARSGLVVYNISYDPPGVGADHPEPFSALACALAIVQADAGAHGGDPGNVAAAGYSFGGLVAAVVTQEPELFFANCGTNAGPAAARMIGIAGSYDLGQLEASAGDALASYFGGTRRDQPALWATADPSTYLGRRPEVPALLVHGLLDRDVDPSVAAEYATALTDAGQTVDLIELEGVGHSTILSPAAPAFGALVEAIVEFVHRPIE